MGNILFSEKLIVISPNPDNIEKSFVDAFKERFGYFPIINQYLESDNSILLVLYNVEDVNNLDIMRLNTGQLDVTLTGMGTMRVRELFIILAHNQNPDMEGNEDVLEKIIKIKFKDVYDFNEWNLYTKNYLWTWAQMFESIHRNFGSYRNVNNTNAEEVVNKQNTKPIIISPTSATIDRTFIGQYRMVFDQFPVVNEYDKVYETVIFILSSYADVNNFDIVSIGNGYFNVNTGNFDSTIVREIYIIVANNQNNTSAQRPLVELIINRLSNVYNFGPNSILIKNIEYTWEQLLLVIKDNLGSHGNTESIIYRNINNNNNNNNSDIYNNPRRTNNNMSSIPDPPDFTNINLFRQLYGDFTNKELISRTNNFPRMNYLAHQFNLNNLGNNNLIANNLSYVFFVRDFNSDSWVNVNIKVANAFVSNAGVLYLINTFGVIRKKYDANSTKDMHIFGSDGFTYGVLPKKNISTRYYVYLNLRYNNGNQFKDKINTLNAKLDKRYINDTVNEFLDFIIRGNAVTAPINNDNLDRQENLGNTYIQPSRPIVDNVGPINNQNTREYTPSPFMPPTINQVTYLTNNNRNMRSVTIDLPEEQYEYNYDEDTDSQETDINTRDDYVNDNDVFESQLEVLENLNDSIPFQSIDPDLEIITESIPNPFIGINNSNDFGEEQSGIIQYTIQENQGQQEKGQEEGYVLNGINDIAARIAGDENLIMNMFNSIFSQESGFKYLPPNGPPPIPAAIPAAIPGAIPAGLPIDIPAAGGGGGAGIGDGGGVGAAVAGMPNLGIYLPGALRNKWVLLAITSSVIVGSFTFLTYMYSSTIKDKLASITSSYINKLEPTLPNSPVQLIEVDEYGNAIRTLNTQQQVIDSYIETIKLSPTLNDYEHQLIDPLLENVVVDTITVKNDDVASTSVYINMKETMYNIIKSGSRLFEGFLPTFGGNDTDIKTVEVINADTEIENKTTILSKLGDYASYAWNLIWFLVKKAIEIVEKAVEGIFSLSKTSLLLIAGAVALGVKYYMNKK